MFRIKILNQILNLHHFIMLHKKTIWVFVNIFLNMQKTKILRMMSKVLHFMLLLEMVVGMFA